jgi:hypothetical protein
VKYQLKGVQWLKTGPMDATNDTGGSSTWVALSKFGIGSFFGRSGRNLVASQNKLEAVPFKVTGARDNDDDGVNKYWSREGSTRSFAGLFSHNEVVQSPCSGYDTPFTSVSPRCEIVQTPHSGSAATPNSPRNEITQSPRSGAQTPNAVSEPPLTPSTRPTSTNSVTYGVAAPPLSQCEMRNNSQWAPYPYPNQTTQTSTAQASASPQQASSLQPSPTASTKGSPNTPLSGTPTNEACKRVPAPLSSKSSMNTNAAYNAMFDGEGVQESSVPVSQLGPFFSRLPVTDMC